MASPILSLEESISLTTLIRLAIQAVQQCPSRCLQYCFHLAYRNYTVATLDKDWTRYEKVIPSLIHACFEILLHHPRLLLEPYHQASIIKVLNVYARIQTNLLFK